MAFSTWHLAFSGQAAKGVIYYRLKMRVIVTLLFATAILCFAATLILHVATFVSSDLGGMRRFFFFHLVVMGVAVITILIYKIRSEPFQPTVLPTWAKVPLILLFSYFVLNMIVLYIVFKGGSPAIVDGSYQLTDHGRLIRDLTAAEYQSFTNWELRFFASGLMIGFAALAAYLWHLREILLPGFREVHLEP